MTVAKTYLTVSWNDPRFKSDGWWPLGTVTSSSNELRIFFHQIELNNGETCVLHIIRTKVKLYILLLNYHKRVCSEFSVLP